LSLILFAFQIGPIYMVHDIWTIKHVRYIVKLFLL